MADETVDYEKIAKAIKEVSDVSTRRYELEIAQAKQIKKLYEERAAGERDLKEIISQNNNILEAEASAARARFQERIRFQAEFEQNQKRLLELKKEESKLETELQKAFDDNNIDQLNQVDEIRKAVVKKIKSTEEEIKIQKIKQTVHRERTDDLEKEASATTDVSDANKGLQSSLRSVLKTTTGLTGEIGGLTGAFIKFRNIEDPFEQLGILNNLAMTVKETFNPLAIADNLLKKIRQSTLKFLIDFDKLAADFRKNTGIIDRGFTGIEQRIVNVQRANLRMGVSMDEAFQAAGSLTSEMASFTGMTDKSQASVLQATTVLQEFGVGAQTTAQIFNNFSKGLGYNASQLEKLSTQLMGISTSLKIPPQIIATEFNAASKELMKYGGDMVNVFKGIAEQSKQTGIAMGELLGIVKQFDTFEGAGAAVGKLNAILGGPYLNSINMLYATEEDRVKMLRESVALSGKQFNQLSRFEQQAIAAAAGITDMTVAGRLFGGTSSEFAKTQMSMKEMQERAAKAQSVQEKFTQVMQSFAIALGPVVHLLGFVADGFLMVMNPIGEIVRIFGSKNSGLIGMFGAITPLIYAAGAAMSLFNVQLFAAKTSMAEIFLPITAALVVFGAFKSMLESMEPGLRTIVGLFIGIAGAIALALAIPSVGGSLLALAAAGAGVGAITSGIYGVVSGIGEFGGGKDEGVSARGGMGVLAEPGAGAELLMKGNGGAYLVSTPSLVELNPQDTVYSNAETKAMLNGGGGNDSAAIAEMRQMIRELTRSQQQQSAAADRRVEAMLDRPVVVSVSDKKLFETMKPQLNRALGLSRTGGVV